MNRLYKVVSVLDENGFNITHKSEFKGYFIVETSIKSSFLNPYKLIDISVSTLDKSKVWKAHSNNAYTSREFCDKTGEEKFIHVVITDNKYTFKLIQE